MHYVVPYLRINLLKIGKKKYHQWVYLGIPPIHESTVALVLSFSTGRVSPHLHVEFDNSFTTIDGCDGNIVPTRYW